MPTYTYECERCGHRFDVFHLTLGSPLSDLFCPECGCLDFKRIIGAPSFKLRLFTQELREMGVLDPPSPTDPNFEDYER